MLISKGNSGKTIGWRETYFSKGESVEVSVHRDVSTITTRDRTTGKFDSKTIIARRRSRQMGRSEKTGCGAFWAVLGAKPTGD